MQRSLPDNVQHSEQTNMLAPGEIRTHDSSKRAVADIALNRTGFNYILLILALWVEIATGYWMDGPGIESQ
jgi:hypothetical protein